MRKMWMAALAAATWVLAGCQPAQTGSTTTGAGRSGAAPVFKVLAGSELRDLEPSLAEFAKSQGMALSVDYRGSLEAADRLMSEHSYDAVWLSHGKYLQLLPEVSKQLKGSEKTMYTPVVLGVHADKAKLVGAKDNGDVSWKNILKAAGQKQIRLAMTSPAGSNTGFVTLVGVAAELSGKGDALTEQDIPRDALNQLFSSVSLTSGSSGDLIARFKADPSKADVVVGYESSIKELKNAGIDLKVLYPQEGVITADYPFMLLGRSKHGDFYQKLLGHIRSDAFQAQVASSGRIPLKGSADQRVLNELPFPANLKVVDALLEGYLNEFSRPSTAFFVLDVSGSMSREGRMDHLKTAMNSLIAADGSVSGRFATFRDREQVHVTPFSNVVFDTSVVELGTGAAKREPLAELARQVAALRPDGGTAIYDALAATYPKALAELKKGNRTVSIVLMTDGENRDGRNLGAFLAEANALSEARVPIYAILYGEANQDEMKALAEFSGGRVFDARKSSLRDTLKVIRTFQ